MRQAARLALRASVGVAILAGELTVAASPLAAGTAAAYAGPAATGAAGVATAVATPGQIVAPPPPELTATASLLVDLTHGITLEEQDADVELPMASTTKVMTALVALERAPDLTALVTVSQAATDVGESEVPLVPGEVVTVGDLLHGMLVRSANDAAWALAEYVGGGSVPAFVSFMNEAAAALGLAHTHFVNPHGLDAPGHYTSARDLLTMSVAAMENPTFAAAVSTPSYAFPPHPQTAEPRELKATNELLGSVPGITGVKTGFTAQAKLCIVASATRGDRTLYAVVLGSDDHFADAAALLEYGFAEFAFVEVLSAGTIYAYVRQAGQPRSVSALDSASRLIPVRLEEQVRNEVDFDVSPPTITALLGEEVLGSVALTVEGDRVDAPATADMFGWWNRYVDALAA